MAEPLSYMGYLANYWIITLICIATIVVGVIFSLSRRNIIKVFLFKSLSMNETRDPFNAKVKKDKQGNEKIYIDRLPKPIFIPMPSNEYIYHLGNKKAVFLALDPNGNVLPMRSPSLKEATKFYDLVAPKEQAKKKITYLEDFYKGKSPHSRLNWLARQVSEAKNQFLETHWWQSPTIMMLGVAFVCLIMFIMFMILIGKVMK